MKRLGIMLVMLLLLTLLGAAGWYFVSPLFLNRTIDEALPFALPALPTAPAAPTIEAESTIEFPADDEVGVIMPPTAVITEEFGTETFATEATVTSEPIAKLAPAATLEPTATTEIIVEEAPANLPIVLGQGHFVDGDSFHKGSGVATLYQTPDGSHLLRFDDFTATNGPDLHVILSPNAHPTDHASLGEYLDLGALKGNIGDQNYTLPADFDSTLYKSVVIYCLPFQVIFATATLE